MGFLMCPPVYCSTKISINPWMDENQTIDCGLLMDSWLDVFNAITRLGGKIKVLSPKYGMQDMSFAANFGVFYGDFFVLSKPRYSHRSDEMPIIKAWLGENKYSTLSLHDDVFFEGEGDFVPLGGDKYLLGYGQRTSFTAVDSIKRCLQCEVIPLQLIDPKFYHLDTALFAIPAAKVVCYYPDAFAPASQQLIKGLWAEQWRILPLNQDEAQSFAANSIVMGKHVILSNEQNRLKSELEQLGCTSEYIACQELQKSGAGIKCLALTLPEKAAESRSRTDQEHSSELLRQ